MLPYCQVQLTALTPPPAAYPTDPTTLGDHLRARRMDRGLLQKDVAANLGTDTATIVNWELGKTRPALAFVPRILDFLGYDPRPEPTTLAERLVVTRHSRGVSRRDAAQQMQVDAATLWRWESGQREPRGRFLERVQAWLAP